MLLPSLPPSLPSILLAHDRTLLIDKEGRKKRKGGRGLEVVGGLSPRQTGQAHLLHTNILPLSPSPSTL